MELRRDTSTGLARAETDTWSQEAEQLDRDVELELAGTNADEAIPGIRARLESCVARNEQDESMRELAQAVD